MRSAGNLDVGNAGNPLEFERRLRVFLDRRFVRHFDGHFDLLDIVGIDSHVRDDAHRYAAIANWVAGFQARD